MKNPHEKGEKAETEETRSRISGLSTVVIVHHSGPPSQSFRQMQGTSPSFI